MIRTRNCFNCKTSFSYEIGKGKDRKHCSEACRLEYQAKGRRVRKSEQILAVCSTQDCGQQANRKVAGLCEACYCQLRRTGNLLRRNAKRFTVTKAGYVRLLLPGHPLSPNKNGYVFEHRKVLFDLIGPGPHSCFWCSESLEWDCIRVDHLDDNKTRNVNENLVVSCNDCNRARGSILPFLKRMRAEAFEQFIKSASLHVKEPAQPRSA